ncbi:MAG: CHASE2 domain-containing protein, partial [Terriglobales bacterium]
MPAAEGGKAQKKFSRNPPGSVAKRRRRRILLDVLVGLCLTVALLILTRFFEATTPGKLLDGALYCWVQTRLGVEQTKIPVVVVDVSQLSVEASPGTLTPREQLTSLIDKVAAQNPAAIGVDIDFSPDEAGWTARGGPQFFDHIRNVPTPVYLGIDRSRYAEPSAWLGSPDYQNLAAAVVIRSDDNQEMPLWIARGADSCLGLASELFTGASNADGGQAKGDGSGDTSCLPAMSFALARSYPDRERRSSHWPSGLFKMYHQELIDKQSGIYTGFFYPDYSVAQYLRSQTSSSVVSDSDVQLVLNPGVTTLRGKIVLLGNTA